MPTLGSNMQEAAAISETEGTFPSGGQTLFRRSVVPANARATLGFIHGYGEHSGRYVHFYRWMAERGVACHAFDFRGQGRSTGRRAYVRRWDEYLQDLSAFLSLDAMRNRGPLFLLAHSHGALLLANAVIRKITGIEPTTGCIMSSPYFRNKVHVPWHKRLIAKCANPIVPWLGVGSGLSETWMSADPAMQADSAADSLITRFATPRWYLETILAQKRALAEAGQFRLPLMMLIGDADPVADPTGGKEFYERAGTADKSIKTYPALLHELLRETEREAIFEEMLSWMRSRTS
jgi:alpha-beta hydrolase superfamily lysophospholipase